MKNATRTQYLDALALIRAAEREAISDAIREQSEVDADGDVWLASTIEIDDPDMILPGDTLTVDWPHPDGLFCQSRTVRVYPEHVGGKGACVTYRVEEIDQ